MIKGVKKVSLIHYADIRVCKEKVDHKNIKSMVYTFPLFNIVSFNDV